MEIKSEISRILNLKFIPHTVTPENFHSVKAEIPRQPGLYKISTNCPIEVLKTTGARMDKMHYNIEKRVLDSYNIPDNIITKQVENQLYCIYNGHNKNLRQRFNEHFAGTQGTGCMALFQIEILKGYEWKFEYLDLNTVDGYIDSPLFRSILEQHLRVKDGWPILCAR